MRRFLILLLLCAFPGFASAGPMRWTYVELGVPAGSLWSWAAGISNRGEIVGSSMAPGDVNHGFLWRKGTMLDMGVPPGHTSFAASAINDRGEIVGYTRFASAWAWKNGAWTDLGFRGAPAKVNRFGDIAGIVYPPDTGLAHASVMEDGTLVDLGTLGGSFSSATAINDAGHVVGIANLADGTSHPFLWQDGVMTDLGALNPLSPGYTGANAINDHGEIVGYSQDVAGGPATAWVYKKSMRVLLEAAFPRAINNHGDVVGETYVSGSWVPFLLADGVLTRIDRIPEVASEGFTSFILLDINDHGWIVGNGWKAGSDYSTAFLLVPKR